MLKYYKKPVAAPPDARRVAIVFWDGHLSVAPSLLSAMQVLADAGFEVDVFIRDWGWILAPVGRLPPGVRIVESGLVRRLCFPNSKRVAPFRLGVMLALPIFLASALRESGRHRYAAVFGVDPLGGFCGRWMAAKLRVPFYYWSLELFASPDTLRTRILSFLQRRACEAAAGILVQDRRRADALLRGTAASHEKILLVPNGPAGPPSLRRSDFLQAKFDIPEGLRIVLHAGMLDDCVLSLRLAESVRAWPGSYCLVLHANQTIPPSNRHVQKIRAVADQRVFLSLDPVPATDVDEVIASATIGLATYEKDLGTNWDLMAAASGKLASYLRNGVPVICTDQTGMRELMERYHCGVAIASVDEIPEALDRISRDYAAFREGAVECYLNEYEFSTHFAPVLDALTPTRARNEAATHALT